jgi:AcrR family transcriptional regulator
MGLRERKKQQMRGRLYEIALDLFRQRGFEDARVIDIVEAAEVSEATFYNYFPSKEAVLRAAAAEVQALYGEVLSAYVDRREEPAPARVRELVRLIGQAFVADRQLTGSLLGRTSIFFGSTGDAADLDRRNYALLAELFAQGQASGDVNPAVDPTQLAEILTAVFVLTITNWVTSWWGNDDDLEPRLMTAVDVVLNGCQAK